jgi:hypothetical protein
MVSTPDVDADVDVDADSMETRHDSSNRALTPECHSVRASAGTLQRATPPKKNVMWSEVNDRGLIRNRGRDSISSWLSLGLLLLLILFVFSLSPDDDDLSR